MGVSEATSLQQPRFGLSQSPLWSDILDRVASQISGGRQVRGSGPSSLQGTASALARVHSHFLVALESGSKIGQDTVSQLATEAVELILAVARVWGTFGTRTNDGRTALADQLRRRLAAQEDAVLAGEVTYSVWSEHAEEPSAAMRHAIACLSRDSTAFQGDLLSLTVAAVDLTALLVRLAANAATSGRGSEAPEQRSAALDAKLGAVTAELAARAQDVERPADQRGDVVAHQLAAGLRVCFSQGMLQRSSAHSTDRTAHPADLEGLRDAWLGLATNEYVAVAALDSQLETPSYDKSFGSLSAIVVEGAANVICGARLIGRPGAFRHPRAWRHQAVALSYALEAYIAGLRGHAPSLAQAQLIALTRLVRATVAIVLIDLARAQALPGNGSPGR
jgi:hypothetical protein